MKKVLLGLGLIVLVALVLAATMAAQPTRAASLRLAPQTSASPASLLFDDFESGGKSSDSSGWSLSTAEAHSPTHSAWTRAQYGVANPTLIYGPFDLRTYADRALASVAVCAFLKAIRAQASISRARWFSAFFDQRTSRPRLRSARNGRPRPPSVAPANRASAASPRSPRRGCGCGP